jgi:hypothetical protein
MIFFLFGLCHGLCFYGKILRCYIYGQNPMKNQGVNYKTAQGSVIIWVMLAVALFAALSFFMMRGSQQNASMAETERARMAASEIIDYARALQDAYKILRINGCRQDQISWQNPVDSNPSKFPNPVAAPADKSCHLFDPNGGSLQYKTFPQPRAPNPVYMGFFWVNPVIEGVGSASADVITAIQNITNPVCIAINTAMNDASQRFIATGFGPIMDSTDTFSAATCPDCVRKKAACIYDTGSNNNNFYYVLEAN